MKNLFTFLVFISVTLNAFSQNATSGENYFQSDLKSMSHNKNHDNLHAFGFKERDECKDDSIEHHILKRFNSNFRVLDSTDYYVGLQDKWIFESRYKTLSFDKYGNALAGKTNFFNSEDYSWSNKYRIDYKYIDPVKHVRDNYLRQVWDSEKSMWLNESYVKYFGDGGYTELYLKEWNFERNCFISGYRYLYTLNNENLASDRIVQKWDTLSNDWANEMKYSYLYTETGKPAEIKIEIWSKAFDNWYVARNDTYEYDFSDNNVRQTIQYWSNYMGWINGYVFENIFDLNNRRISALTRKWNINKAVWDEIQKNEYIYNSNGEMTEMIIYLKDALSNSFVYSQKMIYKVDKNGNQLLYFNQTWDLASQSWINVVRNIRQYNSKGDLTSTLEQNWDRGINAWINNYQEKNTYVRNGFNVQYIKQTWDFELNQWNNLTRRDNYYSGIKENMGHSGKPAICYDDKSDNDKKLEFNIYPNPAKEKVTIKFENSDEFDIRKIELVDFYGKLLKIFNIKGNSDITIYRNGLKNGKYYINFVGKEKVSAILIFN